MHRFFVNSNSLRREQVHLTGEVAHQISRVLRLRLGEEVVLFDGSGTEYHVKLKEFGKNELWADMLSHRQIDTEPATQVTLYLSLLNKPDKFEWALQKCTELGAARFVPVVAKRSVTSSGRGERWERIIQEAVEQSGRGIIPELAEPVPLADALQNEGRLSAAGVEHLSLIPALGARKTLTDAIASSEGRLASVSLFIGPEGGFTENELSAARDNGVWAVTLGPRVLRAETAAVAAVAAILYALGEME